MNILFRIEYFFLSLLVFFVRILPRNLAYSFGRMMGILWAIFAHKRFRVAYENISFAYPDLSKSQKRKMIYQCFQNMALSGIDFFRLDLYSRKDFEELIDFEGLSIVEEMKKRDGGVIFMTAHLGFWESGAFVLPYLGMGVNIVAKKIKNPYIDQLIIRQRSCHGGNVIDRKNGLRKMMRVLQEKKVLAILIDQHIHKEEAVYVPFFGRNAYTSPIIVTLSAKKEIPIVPIFCYRIENNRFRIETHEPVFLEKDSDHGATNTTKINLIIEKAVRKHPEQWMWIHRRWR